MHKPKFITAIIGVMALLSLVGFGIWRGSQTDAQATAVRGGFGGNTLAIGDDVSSNAVNIGFTANFNGVEFTDVFVNTNGNITFDAPTTNFTPFPLANLNRQIIAPFFADVDTRGAGVVRYGPGVVDGRTAFGTTWDGVGYFLQNSVPVNTFQVILIDRSDVNPGDFDIEFNYNTINWEAGDASGGTNGLGGAAARAGYSNASGTSFELPGSAVNGAFLDGGPNALTGNSLNSGVLGRYVFPVRNGGVIIVDSPDLPAPAPISTVREEDTCQLISAQSGNAYLIDVPDAAVPGGAVLCRPINLGGAYVQNPAEIGIQSVIDAGVLQAVDIYGIAASGASVVPFEGPVRACLRGSGRFVFLSAANMSRVPTNVFSFQYEDYTCADLYTAGTAILVEN